MKLIENLKMFLGMIDEDDIITRDRLDKTITNIKELQKSNEDNASLLEDSLDSKSGKKFNSTIKARFESSGLKDVFYGLGLDRDINKNLDALRKVIRDVTNLADGLSGKIIEEDPDTIVKNGASEKQLLIVKIATDLDNISGLLKDILLLTSYSLLEDDMYYKSKSDELKEAIYKRKDLFKYFNDNSSTVMLDGIDRVSNEAGILGSKQLNTSVIGGLKTKFVGSPIYHIGTMWNSYKHEIYEAEVQQAILTSLKIRKLRSQINDGDSESLNKQIEYHEQKLRKLEKSIKEYEE